MRKLSIFLFILLVSAAVCADNFPRIVPDPAVLELSSLESRLDADNFMTYALTLSGADQSMKQNSIDRLNMLMQTIQDEVPFGETDYETAGMILSFLHNNLFTRYSELQTRLDVLFDTGVYNCVSSSIVYIFFAKLYNLNIRGSATSDHAFCSVIIDGEIIDIETTSKYGFDPGKTLEFHDNFGNTTGFAYVPPSDYKNRFIPSELDLLSYILQNRIVKLQRHKHYNQTVPLAVDRYFLLNTKAGMEEMYLEFQNYISFLNSKKQFVNGLEFIAMVTEQYGKIELLQESSDILIHNLIVDAINLGDLEKTREILSSYGRLLSKKESSRIKSLVAKKEISLLIQKDEFEKSLELINKYTSASVISNKDYVDFISILYSNSSITISEKKGNTAAYFHILEGIKLAGKTAELTKALSVYEHNAVIEIHNKFVNAWNSSNFDSAKRIIAKGLEIYPENSILNKDLKQLEK